MMNKNTLDEVRELSKVIFENAAQLVGFFVRDESEERDFFEALKKTGENNLLYFPALQGGTQEEPNNNNTMRKSAFLNFTEKELKQMPKTLSKEFRTQGFTGHLRKREGKKRGYEIRYRRNGYNISVSAPTKERAKERFIEAVQNATPKNEANEVPKNFNEFTQYYFENFRKRKVAEKTLKADILRYNHYIKPAFGSMPIKKITPLQCQKIIDSITDEGHGKTATEIFSLLNVIFKMAMRHGLIISNPLDIVFLPHHERQHGKALTKEEEKTLLASTAGTPYQIMFAVALYTGMRPNEFSTARIDGDFIIAKNSKRKGGKIEYKRIPITPMLRPYLNGVSELKFYAPEQMRIKIRAILPTHKVYDLRTTFYTRCHECGVADVARKLFVGHSLGALGNAYTDISDEFLLKEGAKLDY